MKRHLMATTTPTPTTASVDPAGISTEPRIVIDITSHVIELLAIVR
ncbi:hypothetical protein [Salinibacterium sp. ZJ454]|nr:hypothetical protein [Salinibacterium sp. ZJ454]